MSKEKPAICFVSNLGYLPHLSVALHSFLAHNPLDYEIYLFNEDIDNATFTTLKEDVKNIGTGAQLLDVKLDSSKLNHFTGYWEKLGKQVFHRLLIPELLPIKHEFALYLDADIVIHAPFQWEDFPHKVFPVAAVKDSISHILAPKRGLDNYFNAGVMWLNLPLWREENAVEKLLIHQPKIRRFAEQELLNEVFANRWFKLPLKYNFAANRLRLGNKMPDGTSPIVIHYAGGIKPWKYWVRGSFLYWRYVWQTPFKWRTLHAPETVINSIIHFLEKPFR